MNICFDLDQLLLYPQGGIAVYELELLKALSLHDDVTLYGFFVSSNKNKHCKLIKLLAQHQLLNKIILRRLFLPGRIVALPVIRKIIQKYLIPGNTDLIHFTDGLLPKWYSPEFIPYIITFHDLCFMRHADSNFAPQISKKVIKQTQYAAKHADSIITVSEFSKREICSLLNVDKNKVFVTYNSIQNPTENIDQIQVDEKFLFKYGLKKDQFFLAVGTVSPRKNFYNLLLAFKSHIKKYTEIKLVIIGRAGWNYTEIANLINEIQTNVIWLHTEVDSVDLLRFYKSARGFFMPSFYEGFGIPILEAMACACPVCYGTGSAMAEVAGTSGVGVDPGNVKAIIEAFELFQKRDDTVLHLIEQGYKRTKLFSWDKCAEKTLEVYRSLLSP